MCRGCQTTDSRSKCRDAVHKGSREDQVELSWGGLTFSTETWLSYPTGKMLWRTEPNSKPSYTALNLYPLPSARSPRSCPMFLMDKVYQGRKVCACVCVCPSVSVSVCVSVCVHVFALNTQATHTRILLSTHQRHLGRHRTAVLDHGEHEVLKLLTNKGHVYG